MRTIELDKIYHGDCFELLKEIPDDSIDLILTDPPYNCTRNKWDKAIPLDDFWNEIKRVSKRNAAILVFANQPFTSKLVCSNLSMYRYELVWIKPQGTDFLNANRKPLKAHENIEVFYRNQPTYHKAGVLRGGTIVLQKHLKPRATGGNLRYRQQIAEMAFDV